MTSTPDTLTSASWYLERGFSVVPIIPEQKRPAVAWAEFQKRYATEEELMEWFYETKAWVGLVTGNISQICVLDIDSEEAEESLVHLLDKSVWHSPTVRSRRGGKHVYFAHRESIGSPTGILPGVDVRGEGGIVVVPPSPGYEWLYPLDEEPLQQLPDEIVELCKKAMRARKEEKQYQEKSPMFSYGRRDDDMYSLALHLIRGGWSEQTVLELLNYLAKTWGDNVEDPEIVQWISKKVISACRRSKNTGTLADEVREWVADAKGQFSTKDIYSDLSITEKSGKGAVRQEIKRMTDRFEIERIKSGVYRKVEVDAQRIDFTKVSPNPLDIHWPFGLEEWVSMYPANIAALAGAPNAGKTAFALNFIERNMDRWGIDYYSSEMGQSELRLRLEKFRNRTLDQFGFRAFERSSDWADAIDPDRISVIDYLEVHEDFWAVGKMIQSIHNKLSGHRGIALVLLQKKRGADLGRGAEFGLEKPRLYLTMDTVEEKGILRHRLKVIKAKNWAPGCKENPNGLSFDFKLINGCEFHDERSNALSELIW